MSDTNIPRFLFAPDHEAGQLYILHTQFPLSVILVQQSTPAQLLVIECEISEEDTVYYEERMSKVLTAAADWYRDNVLKLSNEKN